MYVAGDGPLAAGDPDLAVNTLMRHSHFAINQLIIDDLTELLLTGRRAAERTSRLRVREGRSGVYTFLAED